MAGVSVQPDMAILQDEDATLFHRDDVGLRPSFIPETACPARAGIGIPIRPHSTGSNFALPRICVGRRKYASPDAPVATRKDLPPSASAPPGP
jgi:hypothetical protein